MSEINKMSSRKIFHIVSGIFLVVSIAVFAALGISQQYQDLTTTYELADKTTAFLKNECLKFDDYDQGKTAASLQGLLDTASALKDFIPYSAIEDSEFLNNFMHTEHVGGIIVLDKDLSPVALTDIDHSDTFSMWKPLLERDSVKDILDHPEKSYVDTVTLNDIPYDLAIVANDEGSRLIMCYSSTVKPISDPYEYNIDSILANNNFYKDPTVVIADSRKLLSTNNPKLQELDVESLWAIDASIKWQDNKLTQFKYNDRTWYGLRRVCGNYFLYAVYSSDEVFSNRTDVIANGFMIYLLFCLLYLTVQRSFDRRDIHKMEKQLRIIDAISTSYASTFLLHLDTGVLEPLRVSERLQEYFRAHSDPDDFLAYMSEHFTAPESRNTLMEFMNRDTMSERVKGKQFIGTEIRDMNGLWFSMLLIPQKYNDNGDLHAVIVTTRDITDMK